MSEACRGLGARHGDVEIIVPQPQHAEACAHADPFAQRVEDALQRFDRNAVHLNVDILVLPAEQRVPDAAPHKIGAASGALHLRSDLFRHFKVLVHGFFPFRIWILFTAAR